MEAQHYHRGRGHLAVHQGWHSVMPHVVLMTCRGLRFCTAVVSAAWIARAAMCWCPWGLWERTCTAHLWTWALLSVPMQVSLLASHCSLASSLSGLSDYAVPGSFSQEECTCPPPCFNHDILIKPLAVVCFSTWCIHPVAENEQVHMDTFDHASRMMCTVVLPVQA